MTSMSKKIAFYFWNNYLRHNPVAYRDIQDKSVTLYLHVYIQATVYEIIAFALRAK